MASETPGWKNNAWIILVKYDFPTGSDNYDAVGPFDTPDEAATFNAQQMPMKGTVVQMMSKEDLLEYLQSRM